MENKTKEEEVIESKFLFLKSFDDKNLFIVNKDHGSMLRLDFNKMQLVLFNTCILKAVDGDGEDLFDLSYEDDDGVTKELCVRRSDVSDILHYGILYAITEIDVKRLLSRRLLWQHRFDSAVLGVAHFFRRHHIVYKTLVRSTYKSVEFAEFIQWNHLKSFCYVSMVTFLMDSAMREDYVESGNECEVMRSVQWLRLMYERI